MSFSSKPKADVVAEIEKRVLLVPGNNYEFTQPIQMRFNELISGVRSDVAVKVFGDDMDVLNDTAERISQVLEAIPGAQDVKVEQTTGLPMLSVTVDRERTARYGLNVQDVQDTLATAVGGRDAGILFEGDRRFGILVRLPEVLRSDVEAIKRLPIPLPAGPEGSARRFIPLSEVADFSTAPGPNQVSRENGKRRIVVSSNVRGRDLGSFVAEAQQLIGQQVQVPTGYWMVWGGQFENLVAARQRLAIVVPLGLLLIFVLLFVFFFSFGLNQWLCHRRVRP